MLTDEPPAGPVIVTLGDSITRGDGSTVDQEQRYPDHLQRRLPPGAVVLNTGISGNRVLRPGFGPSMTGRFTRDVLSIPEPVLGTMTPLLASVYDSYRAPGNEEIRRLAQPFDCGDGIHLSYAGAEALAEAVDLTLFTRAMRRGPAR